MNLRTLRGTRHPRLDRLLLANASRARLFEHDTENGALRELADFIHPGSRSKGQALDSDRPGRVARGLASTPLQPRTSLAEREREHFAQQLARRLEEDARAQRMPGWRLVASPAFLGRLLETLGPVALGCLREHAARDLTRYSGAELERRVAAVLTPPVAPAD